MLGKSPPSIGPIVPVGVVVFVIEDVDSGLGKSAYGAFEDGGGPLAVGVGLAVRDPTLDRCQRPVKKASVRYR